MIKIYLGILISKRFLKSSFIYTLAGALPMASALLLLPFYVTELSTELYGKLSIFLVFSLFIQIVVTYSFDSSVYIHYHEFKNDRSKLATFISSSYILMLIIGVVAGLVFTLLGDYIFSVLMKDVKISFHPYGVASIVTGIFQGVVKVYSNLLQTRSKSEVFLWSNLILFAIMAVLTICGLYFFEGTLVGPIGGRLIAFMVVGIWALYVTFREFGFEFDFAWLKNSLSFNNYTFLYQIEQWVINYFDRILMALFLPVALVGIYDFGLKTMVAIELIMNGLHSSFFPKVVSTIISQPEKQSTPLINRYYHGLIAVVMILVCGCIFLFPLLIEWIVKNPSYQKSVEYLPYLALIYGIKAIRLYFGAPYGILKYTKPLPVIYLGVSAVKILLMVILIKQFQIYAVIISSFIAAIVEIVLLRMFISGKFNFKFNVAKIILLPALLIVTILLMELFEVISNKMIRHLLYLAVCFIVLVWIYRQEIKSMPWARLWTSKSN